MALGLEGAPIPFQDAICRAPDEEKKKQKLPDPMAYTVTDAWIDWLNRLGGQVTETPFVRNSVTATTQAASVGATDLTGGALNAGLYRITYYARITRAAGTSSSLTVTLGWTDQGQALTPSGTAITGNTVTTFQSASILVYSDAASPITYATTYASVGAPTMQYKLAVTLEQVVA